MISTVTSDHAVCNQLAERDIARLSQLLEDTSNVKQLQMVTATIRNAAGIPWHAALSSVLSSASALSCWVSASKPVKVTSAVRLT